MVEKEKYRECVDCPWCKSLEDSNGEAHYFCMDVNGGAYLEETGLCNWCVPEESLFYSEN